MIRSTLARSFLFVALAACSARGASGDRPAGDSGTPPTDGAANDAGTSTDFGAPLPDGTVLEECRKVDVLFVIDDSASMADQQAALIASFHGFVDAIRTQLHGSPSVHVGVTTSDDYYSGATGCQAIGDLVTQTGGIESSMSACGDFSAGRYLDGTDADLDARFACIAQVGVGGSDDERMARAFLDALDPTRPCNAGFLRPDALLVAVLITDEDDVPDADTLGSGGTPDEWLAEATTRRDPSSVVMLSLIGRSAGNPCGAVVNSRILGLTHRFDQNAVGDVCDTSYDTFFRDALPTIGSACYNLI